LENLKKIRKENNLTQLALQLKTGIDQAMLSKYETGERIPTVENFCILANYFGTSLDFMMDRTEERTPYAPAKKP
jgi:transcriptional regulator, XRE family